MVILFVGIVPARKIGHDAYRQDHPGAAGTVFDQTETPSTISLKQRLRSPEMPSSIRLKCRLRWAEIRNQMIGAAH
jgi:hypothetical protein